MQNYLRHCFAQVQTLASGAQFLPFPPSPLPPPLPPFNVVSLDGLCPKHFPTTLTGGGGVLAGIDGFPVGRGNIDYARVGFG